MGIRDVVDIFVGLVSVACDRLKQSTIFNIFLLVGEYYVYGHIMLKAPVLVRSLKLSNIESR